MANPFPVPPYCPLIIDPFQVPVVIVPTVVKEDEPLNGEAPTELYEIVLPELPLYELPDASPLPPSENVKACATEPAEPPIVIPERSGKSEATNALKLGAPLLLVGPAKT